MSKERTYTKAGYEALLLEMKALEEAIEKNKKDISTARSFGDLSENSEYTEAKEEQTKLAYRKEELKDMIKNAVVVEESELDDSVVGIGSFVTVFHKERNKETEYHIVGSYEADPFSGKISDQSPIGAALVGKRAGDVATAELPNGNEVHLEIRATRR
ncbi:MAG: transcription elongation factor GreA [Clostridia bacterium]|nr:transcription elongation factor GreA [Clostridia bacterium]